MHQKPEIAIVGMGGVFPGANDPPTFWLNIIEKIDTAAEVPSHRWGIDPASIHTPAPLPDRVVSTRACLLTDFTFDPEGFSVSPEILQDLDPLYHIALHAGRDAVTHVHTHGVESHRMGIIMAAIALPTQMASAMSQTVRGGSLAHRLHLIPSAVALSREGALASRVTGLPGTLLAAALGFHAEAYTLDAACASSLVALKLACDNLQSGRADIMLAGGLSRPDALYTQVGFSQLRALSPSGRCAPFDHRADGLVVGEGAGLVALKRLEDAEIAGDHIFAVIKGIGLSNDIPGSLLAPQNEGQLRAMRQAYQQASWDPRDVDAIECHGAGTVLGDITELNSLSTLWGSEGWERSQCSIGSVKSMIGHLLTGAGAAGLIKMLLALEHRTLPPSLNFERPADGSPLSASPFYVQTDAAEWRPHRTDRPRRAAVSAFGFGGINAHVLLEQYQYPSAPRTPHPIGHGAELPPADGGVSPTAAAAVSKAASAPTDSDRGAIAIVGLETAFGPFIHLDALQSAIVEGRSGIGPRPKARWRGCDAIADALAGLGRLAGAYMHTISTWIGEFQIPPNEVADFLPQHLLMLKVAIGALHNSMTEVGASDDRSAVVIGGEFDYETTNFHLRWKLPQMVAAWQSAGILPAGEVNLAHCGTALRDFFSPPLTATRTLGSLSGVIASRIAKCLRFGGPSMVVSNDELSGLRALEIGMQLLRQRTVDRVLVGAVDFAGDVRQVLIREVMSPHSRTGRIRPFDNKADGTLPGDGAVALVLMRAEAAREQGRHIHATINGTGSERSTQPWDASQIQRAYRRSLQKALHAATLHPERISCIETHGSGDPLQDSIEAKALHEWAAKHRNADCAPCCIGTFKPLVGHTGAVAGLASVAKTAICLEARTLPPAANTTTPRLPLWQQGFFEIPHASQPWIHSSSDNSLHAAVAAMTPEGDCMHVIVQSASRPADVAIEQSAVPLSDSSRSGEQAFELSVGGHPPELPHPIVLVEPSKPKAAPIVPPDRQKTPMTDTRPATDDRQAAMASQMAQTIETTTRIHEQFLDLSREMRQALADGYARQNRLVETLMGHSTSSSKPPTTQASPTTKPQAVAFDRQMCLEFAGGSVAKVLGPEFAVVDGFDVRVRLPEEPLMLVDRIISIEGEKCAMTGGRIVTEHDVLPDAWYLDAGRAPVCIAVEAGQADLFLCAYLGIDHQVQGERAYRLLDATVEFHRRLPRPGETIRYEIEIERFTRQGPTYLFFFNFKGYVGGVPLITMTKGCAGFFTPEEVRNSGGIIMTAEDEALLPGQVDPDWTPVVPLNDAAYDADALEALRRGDLAACFGKCFEGIDLPEVLRLPGGRMRLLDRILSLEPQGGRFGLGRVRAEADIDPEAWFLTCHFKDDMVMPGTLMYECCAHALRVFLQRLGWVVAGEDACYEPVPGVKSVLKCRGPVTPATQHVIYDVEIKALGYRPEPYAIADAHMYADGHRIVKFIDMSMRLTSVDRQKIERFWSQRVASTEATQDPCAPDGKPIDADPPPSPSKPVFTREQVLEFATGKPSKAFGEAYRPFDRDRFIARLPAPPYSFLDHIATCEPEPWILKPGGWVEALYRVQPRDWYFAANRTPTMPYCIMNEIALQTCGWLAAYMGSALRSEQDLRFRNLGGEAVVIEDILPDVMPLTTRARLTQVSEAAEMIIEHYNFEIYCGNRKIYHGKTHFGFFTAEALANQVGLYHDGEFDLRASTGHSTTDQWIDLADSAPLTPDAAQHADIFQGAGMPARALRMIDRITAYAPAERQSGFIKGIKQIDPQEWFFKAHFHQDPVCPGSLGLESLLQLIKYAATQQWPELCKTHRFGSIPGLTHRWTYRGQIVPSHHTVGVEAQFTQPANRPLPELRATGYLSVDNLYIYHMEDFGLRLVPLA